MGNVHGESKHAALLKSLNGLNQHEAIAVIEQYEKEVAFLRAQVSALRQSFQLHWDADNECWYVRE